MQTLIIKIIFSILIFSLMTSGIANAGPRGDMKRKAQLEAKKLRSDGEPLDRCAFNVSFAPNITVIEILGETNFQIGDVVKSIDGHDFSEQDREAFVDHLRKQSPEKISNVSVTRNLLVRSFSETCSNSRPKFEAILKALDYASKKKFDDCYDALSNQDGLGFTGLQYQLQCAEVSRNKERYDYGQLTYDALEKAITSARWYPPIRKEVMQMLVNMNESLKKSVGKVETENLILSSRTWPGDETLWDEMQPNFAQFRATAEAVIIRRLIDPDSAKVEWPYEFLYGTWKPVLQNKIEGYWTCGFVNARNRMGGYTGKTFFVSVIGTNGSMKYIDIGSSDDVDIISSQCQNSIKMLTLRVEDLKSVASSSDKKSLVDDLAALVELHKSGAITDEEFEMAKAKVLSK